MSVNELPIIETRLLHSFVTIADAGSLQKASIRIGKSKSTLSRWLSEFEDLIGYEVFERKSNGLVLDLNREGRALLPKAQSVLASLTRFSAQAYSINLSETPAKINLAFNQFIEHECIAEVIAHLKQNYPETEINLISDVTKQTHELLQDGDVDLILTTVPEAIYPDIGGNQVGEEQVMLVAHHDHPLVNLPSEGQSQKSNETIDFQTLLAETLIVPKHLQGLSYTNQIRPLDTITTSDFNLSIHCAQKGVGIAYVPAHAARQHLLSGEIRQLNMNWEELNQVIPLMLTFRLNYPYQKIKQELTEILRQWFGYQSN